MRIVTDDGVALEVVEQGTGPALLLVHGFGGGTTAPSMSRGSRAQIVMNG